MLYGAYMNCGCFWVKSNDRRNYIKVNFLVESQITFTIEVS